MASRWRAVVVVCVVIGSTSKGGRAGCGPLRLILDQTGAEVGFRNGSARSGGHVAP